MSAQPDIRAVVREKYGEIAKGSSTCGCGPSCCSGSEGESGRKIGEHIGYDAQQLDAVPEGANLGLGCGNPLAHASVKPGDVVLDLGSGAGMDAFLAAREVGPTGRVIGVDMTADMVERARENARKGGFANVEFRLGEIERLPVAGASVDIIISNCVINLSPDKESVFAEAFRVLKPGGRLVVSDLVLKQPLSDDVRHSVEAYVGCVAGASMHSEYLALMRAAGFEDVRTLEERSYGDADVFGGYEWLREAARSVVSAKVRAVKPQR
jgi:arsenite methyltransferase